MSLKELTQEQHRRAETRPFVKVLFSGHVDPKIYATYLINQHPMYDVLEAFAMMHGLFNGIPEIRRAPAILEDFVELWNTEEYGDPTICPVVNDYVNYLKTIYADPDKIMAHLYVRHMGDLSGGQMIAKRVPGSGKYYQFGDNPEVIKDAIRAKLNDDMADEAKIAFDFAARLFEEMMDVVGEQPEETVDEQQPE
jgi:heme oxygenase